MYPVCHWNPFAPGQPLFGMGSPYIPDGHNAAQQTMENEDNSVAYFRAKFACRFLFKPTRTYINSWKPLRIYFHCLEGNCGKLLQRILEFFFFCKGMGNFEHCALYFHIRRARRSSTNVKMTLFTTISSPCFAIQLRAFRLSAVRRSLFCETNIE